MRLGGLCVFFCLFVESSKGLSVDESCRVCNVGISSGLGSLELVELA